MVKFSIITPSFNQADYLEETIKSIWSQKGNFAIEHIVMDGKSTDKSVNILKRYERLLKQKKFPVKCKALRFIWKSERDRGQTDAINKGLQLTTGAILAYLNSDDTYCPGAFQKVTNFFQRHPHSKVVFGDYWKIDQNSKRLSRQACRPFSKNDILNRGNPVGQPTVFFKKEVYEQIGEFNAQYRYCMDYDYWCRIVKKYRFYCLRGTALANFRLHDASKTVSQSAKFWQEQRRASLENGGKFFSPMWLDHQIQRFESLSKGHLPSPITALLKKGWKAARSYIGL
jgi:glycosyltransferase involved in cell wall biosynthesis